MYLAKKICYNVGFHFQAWGVKMSITIFWQDKAKVERQEISAGDYFSKNKLKTIYRQISCHLAVKSRLIPIRENRQATALDYDYVLFCAPRYIFKLNDKITVTRPNGEVLELYAGQSHNYRDTCQVDLSFTPIAPEAA